MAGQPTTSVPVKKLLSAITATATAFSVSDILDWDGNALVTNRFGSTGYGVFRSPDGTQVEFFTFDPTTIANTNITILTRGNDYNGGTTDNIKTKYAWPAGTLVELGSMAPAMLAQVTAATFNASSTVIGSSKLSVDPVSPTIPIAVGQNDTKMSPVALTTVTAGQVAALLSNTTPVTGNKYITQLDSQKAQETYIASSGSANAYVVAYAPVVAALLEGQMFGFKANFSNTGAATLAVNGLTAKAITKNGTTALIANDILSGQIIMVRYDGTQFQMLTPPGVPVAAVESSASVSVSGSGTSFTQDDAGTVTLVLPKAQRVILIFAGQETGIASNGQSQTFAVQFNVDSGTIIGGYSVTYQPTLSISENGSCSVITASLTAASHTFNMRITGSSGSSMSRSIVGTLYAVAIN